MCHYKYIVMAYVKGAVNLKEMFEDQIEECALHYQGETPASFQKHSTVKSD